MSNLKTHVNFGIFTYPAYVFAFLSLTKAFGENFSPDVYAIAVGYFVYVVGSDLPDIDSDTAPMHHFLKVMMTVLGTFAILDWSGAWLAAKFGGGAYYPAILSSFMLASAAASYGAITLVLKLRLFRHRGFAHSFTFAVVYALGLCLAFYKNRGFSPYVPIAGGLGVMLHMFVDYRREPSKIFKLW